MPKNPESHSGGPKKTPDYLINKEELARYADLHQERKMREDQAELMRGTIASTTSEGARTLAKGALKDHLARLETIDEELSELEETRPDPKKLN
jgi:hypothetical protein